MPDTIPIEKQQTQEEQFESALRDVQEGSPDASADLLPLMYSELRKLAESRLASEPAGQTLQATALVHEAYLRLTKNDNQQKSYSLKVSPIRKRPPKTLLPAKGSSRIQ